MNEKVTTYKNIANIINPHKDIKIKTGDKFGYVEGQQDRYEGFIDSLFNSNLLKPRGTLNICDVGFGLGTTLYNISQQLKTYEDFSTSNNLALNLSYWGTLQHVGYYGVEYDKELIDKFEQHLSMFWSNSLNLYHKDCMDISYEGYDILLIYTPFRDKTKRKELYKKILREMKPGAILYEHMFNGYGEDAMLHNLANEYDVTTKQLLFGGCVNEVIIK